LSGAFADTSHKQISSILKGYIMGLFDAIVGQVSSTLVNTGTSGGQGGLMDIVSGLINNPQTGGIEGLVKSFQDKGLGDAMASWIGTGVNQAISGEQIRHVLGSEQVQALAQKFGLSSTDMTEGLSRLLPEVIDKLTPNGQVPEGGLLAQGLSMLKGFSHSA
jgi:uncharacterized protein YidB (DUF937 family)